MLIDSDYDILVNLGYKHLSFIQSPNPKFGDLSISTHQLTEFERKSLIEKLKTDWRIEKLEVIGGFVNVFFDNLFLIKKVFIESSKSNKGGLITCEMGDPNTHKLPHIGHLYSYFYGDSVANLYEHIGYKVVRLCYQGDIGLHVAKCLYFAKDTYQKYLDSSLEEKMVFLQSCYQKGAGVYEDDPKAKDEIDRLNKNIYSQNDPNLNDAWSITKSWSAAYIRGFENDLGIHQDLCVFESELVKRAVELVNSNIPNIFSKSDGAVIFEKEKNGLHTRVFINKFGFPTYEAKDLALAEKKILLYPEATKHIVPTGNEQNEYFQVMINALTHLHPNSKNKYLHLGFGMVRLPEGKISSRKGALHASELINMVKSEVAKLSKTSLSQENIMKIALSALKWHFLNHDFHQSTIFDLHKAVQLTGNTGPYLLYTSVRCGAVLAKVGEFNFDHDLGSRNITGERDLLWKLSRFSEIVEESATKYSPHILTNYLYELSQVFNRFYENEKIIGSENTVEALRLALCQQTKKTIDKGLDLLGISTVEKM